MDKHGNSKGKCLKKFKFTYKDYANLTSLSYTTVREYARQGKFNPDSLASVVVFIDKHKPKASK